MENRPGCDQISCLLEAQLNACDEIIALSLNEQQVLLDRRSSALPEIVTAKERCADHLADLQEAFRKALTSWEASPEPGSDVDALPPLSLRQLLPYLPLEQQTRLETLQQSLLSRTRTLRVLNRAIALLIKSSLAQAEAWLSLLADMTGQNTAYDAGGQVKIGDIGGSQLLDHQA